MVKKKSIEQPQAAEEDVGGISGYRYTLNSEGKTVSKKAFAKNPAKPKAVSKKAVAEKVKSVTGKAKAEPKKGKSVSKKPKVEPEKAKPEVEEPKKGKSDSKKPKGEPEKAKPEVEMAITVSKKAKTAEKKLKAVRDSKLEDETSENERPLIVRCRPHMSQSLVQNFTPKQKKLLKKLVLVVCYI